MMKQKQSQKMQKLQKMQLEQQKKARQKLKRRVEELDLPERSKLRAVAVKYDLRKDKAPKIVAGGRGLIAEKILQVAEENAVPLYEDPTLTDLLSKLELDQEIPGELYALVAEVLAFVYQLDKLAKKRRAVRRKFSKRKK